MSASQRDARLALVAGCAGFALGALGAAGVVWAKGRRTPVGDGRLETGEQELRVRTPPRLRRGMLNRKGSLVVQEGRLYVDPVLSVDTQLYEERPPLVVGVAGGTGSGKTTFADAIFKTLGEEHVTYITHDSYYKDLSHLSLEERAKANFDHPNSLDTALLIEHVIRLRDGETVEIPAYDFTQHTRMRKTFLAEPRRVILVEGILIFTDPELVKLMNIKVFVDVEADVRLIRRIRRDMKYRGRTLESIIDQYMATVRPMHMDFVEPSKRVADVIIPLGANQVALDMFLSRLEQEIERGPTSREW